MTIEIIIHYVKNLGWQKLEIGMDAKLQKSGTIKLYYMP